MRTYTLFQVDSFTNRVFGGNPAGVCIMDEWLPEDVMQNIAMENNLSETAFVVGVNRGYEIRWFTPLSEVELCGHATLAAAYVIFEKSDYVHNQIIFSTKFRGELIVQRSGDWIQMDFPADTPKNIHPPADLISAIGVNPDVCLRATTDYLLIYSDQTIIDSISPDFRKLKELDVRGVIISSPGIEVDFVSRFFAPGVGIDEDPVTGSAHTTLIPYWSKRLDKEELLAEQRSQRRGTIRCRNEGDRVIISGQAKLYMQAEIYIPA